MSRINDILIAAVLSRGDRGGKSLVRLLCGSMITLGTMVVLGFYLAAPSASLASEVDPSMSLETIQGIVNQGGTVLFTEGIYDFQNGSIQLGQSGNPVTVRGQRDAEGNYLTEIVNGESTFIAGCEAIPGVFGCSPATESITDIEIRDLHFRNSRIVSIMAIAFTDLKIVGNKFTGARLIDALAHPVGMAISIGTWEAWGSGIPKECASGRVLVQDNFIDGRGYATAESDDPNLDDEPVYRWFRWWSGTSNGIAVTSVDAHVRIVDNEAYDILSTCISNRDVGGTSIIMGNRVSSYHAWSGGGILVCDLDKVRVTDNEVETVGDGVVLDAVVKAVVRGNLVRISPLVVWGEEWLGHGIRLGYSIGPAIGASVVGNDFTGYAPGPSVAHIFVKSGSSHNLLMNNQYALLNHDSGGVNVHFEADTVDNTLVCGAWKGDLVIVNESNGTNRIICPVSHDED